MASPGAGSVSSTKLSPSVDHRRAAGEGAEPQLRALQVDQDADRPAGVRLDAADHADQLAHAVVAGVAHVDAEHVGAGLEQAARSSRRRTRPGRAWRRSWRGAGVSLLAAPPRGGGGAAAGGRLACRRRARRQRRAAGVCSAVSVSCTVQERCSPVSTSKKPVRSIAARQAIVGAADGEFLFARAHEGLAGPFAAAVVVDRVDVIVARNQRAAQQRFAGCAPTRSTSLRWSSLRRPCSRCATPTRLPVLLHSRKSA